MKTIRLSAWPLSTVYRLPSVLLAFLLLLLSLPASAQVGDFTYDPILNTITITGYTGPGGNVTIPAAISGLPVTTIGGEAFSSCTNLTSVTIPDSVTAIGYNSFNSCTKLTNVIIGTNVTSIGELAFLFCTSLAAITIPDSVTNIGGYAFACCNNLTSVTTGNSVTNIGAGSFGWCTNLTSVTIGRSVITIDEMAFSECTSLASVIFPDSVTYIVSAAFYGCTSLTNITIGNGLTNLNNDPFPGCPNLASVTVPSNVTSIGLAAFAGWSSLTTFTVATNNPVYSSLDGVLFDKHQTTLIQCPGGKAGSYTIPDSVTYIGDHAFRGCTSLTNVHCEGNAPDLGWEVFSSATNATIYYSWDTTGWGLSFGGRPTVMLIPFNYETNNGTITITSFYGSEAILYIPSSFIGLPITRIADGAFAGSTTLTKVILANTITSIGSSAFAGCTSLTSVCLQGDAPSLGANVFLNADNATIYYLPDTAGWGPAFGGRPAEMLPPFTFTTKNATITITGYTGTNSAVVIPGTIIGLPVSSIGATFARSTNLASITIPNSVTAIGDGAFYGCASLASVTIPDSVTGIGAGAFAGCTSLASATIGNSVTSMGHSAFSGCSNLVLCHLNYET